MDRVTLNWLKKLMRQRKAGAAERREDGYSLLEILIVLAIMGVIATLVGPRLFNQFDRSKVTVAEAQIRALESALDTMRLDIGRYPTEEEGLSMLVQPPSDPRLRQLWLGGPYMDGELPLDPWGQPYRYAVANADRMGFENRPLVYSFGRDNKRGGSGLDADIGRSDGLAVLGNSSGGL